jgi:hypothetical protein
MDDTTHSANMNAHATSQEDTTETGGHLPPAAIVLRSLLAVFVCLLAWLCVRTALATERASLLFHRLFPDSAPPELSGVLWQHPRLLLAFAVVVALIALACLAFSKAQRRAMLVAGLVIVLLLVQWVVVTPAVGNSTLRMLQRAAQEVAK